MSSSFQDWDSQERATLHLCPLLSALHWGLVKETDFSLTLGADEGRRPQSYTGGWRREQAPVLYCGTVKQAGHHKVLIMWSWEIHFYSLMMTQFQAFCSSITKSYPFQPLHWATSHHLNENRGQYHCQTQALLPALLMGYKALRNLLSTQGQGTQEKRMCVLECYRAAHCPDHEPQAVAAETLCIWTICFSLQASPTRLRYALWTILLNLYNKKVLLLFGTYKKINLWTTLSAVFKTLGSLSYWKLNLWRISFILSIDGKKCKMKIADTLFNGYLQTNVYTFSQVLAVSHERRRWQRYNLRAEGAGVLKKSIVAHNSSVSMHSHPVLFKRKLRGWTWDC